MTDTTTSRIKKTGELFSGQAYIDTGKCQVPLWKMVEALLIGDYEAMRTRWLGLTDRDIFDISAYLADNPDDGRDPEWLRIMNEGLTTMSPYSRTKYWYDLGWKDGEKAIKPKVFKGLAWAVATGFVLGAAVATVLLMAIGAR